MAPGTTQGLAPPPDLVDVGRVAAAHGVHGWLKIQPYSQQGEALRSTDAWWLAPEGSETAPTRADVLACRVAGSCLLAKIENVTDREAALALRGWAVRVSRAQFPPAAADEYYWVDLIGCLLYGLRDTQQVLLGQVGDIFDNGAHAVLEVTPGTVSDEGIFRAQADACTRPVLVPFVAAHIRRVDLQARRIESDWPAEF